MSKNRYKNHGVLTSALALVCLLAPAWTASAQTVLVRARIGNNVEGMTYVGNGPLQNSIVFADGHQLRSVSAEPCERRCPVRELLDLKTLPISSRINGLAYVSTEKKFLLWEFTYPSSWLILDKNAQPLAETRPVTHLPGLGVNGGEGMVYVPSSSRRFGDRVLASTYDTNYITHIEVFRRDGQAVAEIVPQGALDPSVETITGLGFMPPDKLLVGTEDHSLWVMDFDGNVVQGPIDASPNTDFEGVIRTSEGKIVAASYADGNLLFFDSAFRRLPALDRDVRIGIGRARPKGVAWDPDLHSLIVDPVGPNFVQELDSLPLSLDSYVKVADLPLFGNGLTYLGAERRIGMTHQSEIILFDNSGAQTEAVTIQDPSGGAPRQVTFVPSRQQFVLRLDDNLLHVAARNGDFVRDIDPSGFGVTAPEGIAFFPARRGDPNPAGNLAITDAATKHVVFVDVDGTRLLGSLDYRDPGTLNMVAMRLGYIGTGELAGSFIGFDVNNSEIIIFRR